MDELPEAPIFVSETSPLRALLIEFHETFKELRTVGFTEKQATAIVAHMVESAVASRNEDDFDIEFVDDEDEDEDAYDDGPEE